MWVQASPTLPVPLVGFAGHDYINVSELGCWYMGGPIAPRGCHPDTFVAMSMPTVKHATVDAAAYCVMKFVWKAEINRADFVESLKLVI